MTTRIPKILHYTFGLAKDFGGQPWSLVHHVCLKSAVERIQPEQVFLYYEYEPAGAWWELSRKLVTPVKIEAPKEIFGRPLRHVAHRADVVRLQKLIDHGGIYLDADVLVQRSFDSLLNYSTVLGSEGVGAAEGLANAVILGERNAPFLNRWLDSYRSFRGNGMKEYWSEHSVRLPAVMAKAYPADVTVLPHTAFFWPLWTPEHLRWIFDSTQAIPLEHAYASHLWESVAAEFLRDLTPGLVRAKDSNFHFWARPLLAGLPDDFGAGSAQQGRLKAGVERGLNKVRDMLRFYKQSLRGSDGATEHYVNCMAELLAEHALDLGRPITVVDIGCGDSAVGRELTARLPDLIYVGCDIVPEVIVHNAAHFANERISFRQVDFLCDSMPDGDVCLIRHLFQHLPNADILAAVQRLDYPIAYVTEAHPVGQGRGVELSQARFSLSTREMFRFSLPPGEVIVTERVELPAAIRGRRSRASTA